MSDDTTPQDGKAMSPASTGSVVYRTFDDWHSEVEGFAMRCERLEGPTDELRAAFAAGQSGMRLTGEEKKALSRIYDLLNQRSGELQAARRIEESTPFVQLAKTVQLMWERLK